MKCYYLNITRKFLSTSTCKPPPLHQETLRKPPFVARSTAREKYANVLCGGSSPKRLLLQRRRCGECVSSSQRNWNDYIAIIA